MNKKEKILKTASEIDEVLLYLINSAPGIFDMNELRVAKVKEVWDLLHQADPDYCYIFRNNYTELHKEPGVAATIRLMEQRRIELKSKLSRNNKSKQNENQVFKS
jgi:hypothetical protein